MKKIKKITLLSLFLFIAIILSACGSSGGSGNTNSYYYHPADNTNNNNQQNNTPNVQENKIITLSKNQFTLDIGKTENVIVYVNGEDKTKQSTFELVNENVKKSTVATVEEGLITAIKPGSAFFKASYEEGSTYFTVIVNNPALSTLEVSKSEINLELGNVETENVTVTLNGKDVTSEATFTSSNENIVKVENGNIQAINEGTATIIVQVDGANDVQINVTVTDPNSQIITTNFDSVNLYIGNTKNIVVKVGGINKTNDSDYTSSDESIAKVDSNGLITAIGEGNTTITIKVDGIEESKIINVTVNNYTLTLSKSAFELGLIDTDTITITNNENDDVTKEATYTSNDESIATVDKNGNITAGYNAGTATITVHVDGAEDTTFTVTVNDDSTEVTLANDNIVLEQLGYQKVSYNDFYDIKKDNQIMTSLTIPPVYVFEENKYKITAIGEKAFYRCNSITKNITLPNTIKSIGNNAFYECTALENLTLGNATETIGQYAFYNCNSLNNITIPDNVTSIGNYTFSGCSSLINITIPDNVTTIGAYAFQNCSSLTNINIPDNVTSIGQYAFSVCSSLTNINIPDNVTTIGQYAFSVCSSLTNINIPDNVTTIGQYAFNNCTSLELILPNNINIGTNAFYGVKNLTYNFLDNYTSSKGWGAYGITLADGITTIPHSAFYNCSTLRTITIPDTVTSIESIPSRGYNYSDRKYYYGAFDSCANLKTVNLSNQITDIGNFAFYYCNNLTEINIPDNVTNIGQYAFASCNNLDVTLPDNISVGNYAFSGVKNLTYNLNAYPSGKGWVASGITITDGVTSIGDNAFNWCYSLKSITIPDSVTSIGQSAFYYCYSLTNVTINGNNLKTIGSQAFYNCYNSKLTITIPNSVTSIGNNAFYEVPHIYYYGTSTSGIPWGANAYNNN